MKQTLYILYIIVATLATGCTGKDSHSAEGNGWHSHPNDTAYTQQAAMAVYGYDPVRALQIVDSAVIVGNLCEVCADLNRTRIYSQTLQTQRLDSLLGGPQGVCLDTARAIGERLLHSDSAKANIILRKDVLGILVYVARMQQDTTLWMQRSKELVDVSRQVGDKTGAMRTEAELAATLFYMGQPARSYAMLDSIISSLERRAESAELDAVRSSSTAPTAEANPGLNTTNSGFKFNELDALIIASKRKIGLLISQTRYTETLHLAYNILKRLDDYEQHPDRYHDGSSREPNGTANRADYISFYRSQAQNFITAAYAALGNSEGMEATFHKIEQTVREATTREHMARYRALEQQKEAERQQARADRNLIIAVAAVIVALLAVGLAVVFIRKKRIVSEKNRALVRQIDEAMRYKKQAHPNRDARPRSGENSSGSLFAQLSNIIETEQLFLDPTFDRQTLIDRYGLSKERIGAAFTRGSDHPSLSAYVNNLRLEHAYQLLLEQPDLTLEQVATQSGFSSRKYFGDRFKTRFGMTPTEFRLAHL